MAITKIRALPAATMKFKASTGLPGSIEGGEGISVTKAAGVWTITSTFSPGTGTWVGDPIDAEHGGTGLTSYVLGDMLYADSTTTLARLAASTSGYAVMSNGAGVALSYQGFTQTGTGAVTRTWQSKGWETKSVDDFGADPTGAASSSAAFAAAHASGFDIKVPYGGTYKLSTDQTWPVGKVWRIEGTLSIDTGVTITNLGEVLAGFNQIFTGSGTILGMRFARPEWWGATNGGIAGAHDDLAAINKALACVQASTASRGDRAEVLLSSGLGYMVSGPIVLSPTVYIPLKFGGAGIGAGNATRIIAMSSFVGDHVVLVDGQSDSTLSIMNFHLHDFVIAAESVLSGVRGLAFGSNGKNISGVGRSLVENISIASVSTGIDWGGSGNVSSVRLIDFRAIQVWLPDLNNAIGLSMDIAASASSFFGDINFYDFQVVGSTNAAITGQVGHYYKGNRGTGGGIAGLRFFNPIVYTCEHAVYGTFDDLQGSGDIWYYAPQFEGGVVVNGINGVTLNAVNGSTAHPQIYNWNLIDPWINNMKGRSIYVSAAVAGTAQVVNIRGDMISTGALLPIELKNVYGGKIDITLRGTGGGLTELIKLSGATQHVSIGGCPVIEGGTPAPTYFVTIADTADYNTVGPCAANGTFGTAFANITSSGTHNTVIDLPGTTSKTGTGALVLANSPTIDSPTISGTATITAAATVSSLWTFTTTPTVQSSAAGAATGPFLNLYRNSTGAADNLIGAFNYIGNNSTPTFFTFARTQGKIKDPTAASEDGEYSVWTAVNGALAERFTVGQGGQVGAPTGGDKGTGTLNVATGLYVANVAVPTISSADELTNKTLNAAVAKGTWTASGTWTLPALTLGGTVSGGGNQVNNVIIGTSTPLAGSFTTVAASTSVTVTSASANALTAGRQGATNPALQVDASTATSATGLKIKSAAAAGGLALSVITSGTNENLTLDAAGSGTITLGGTSTGAITLTRAVTLSAALTYGGVTLSNAVTGTGNMVLSSSPTLVTPTLGVATATSFNGNFWTAGTGTLAIGAGKTATVSNTLTFTGTDGSTVACGAGGTVAYVGGVIVLPQGRLTLATATPVMITSQAGKTTIYYTAYRGNQIPIYDGTNMVPTVITGGEINVATTDTTKSPAAIGASKVNDWFVWNDSGTIRIGHGPDWTDDVTRSAGTALVQVNGIYLNNASITNGPAASRGTYVGTTRSDASSQLNWVFGASASGGTAALLCVWNTYNQVRALTQVIDTATAYTYGSGTFRSSNASDANRVSWVIGLNEGVVDLEYTQAANVAAGGSPNFCSVGIGINSTSTTSGRRGAFLNYDASVVNGDQAIARHVLYPGLGFQFAQALESSGGGTNTFNQNVNGSLSADLMM